MRIGILAAGELFGGVERHVLGISSGLQAHDAKIFLFLFHDGELAAQARAKDMDPIVLPSSNLALPATARRLAGILEHNDIRIMHVHGYKATVFGAAAQNRHPFAMFKTEHGLPEPMGNLSLRGWRNHLYFAAEAAAARHADASVFYVTKDLRAHYRKAHAGLRTAVVPNGVDDMQAAQFPRPPEFARDGLNLLIAGRIDLVKGHELAIRAIADRRLPTNINLYVIGDGPCTAELRALAETCGLGSRVQMLGFRRNVYDYIAHCDVLLMPSLHEGLPYTLLEAMALAKPVIASRVGGLAETLQDNVTALLVPPSDPHALAQAIGRMSSDPALRSTLGNNAQRLQRDRYSIEAMTESYLSHYLHHKRPGTAQSHAT